MLCSMSWRAISQPSTWVFSVNVLSMYLLLLLNQTRQSNKAKDLCEITEKVQRKSVPSIIQSSRRKSSLIPRRSVPASHFACWRKVDSAAVSYSHLHFTMLQHISTPAVVQTFLLLGEVLIYIPPTTLVFFLFLMWDWFFSLWWVSIKLNESWIWLDESVGFCPVVKESKGSRRNV